MLLLIVGILVGGWESGSRIWQWSPPELALRKSETYSGEEQNGCKEGTTRLKSLWSLHVFDCPGLGMSNKQLRQAPAKPYSCKLQPIFWTAPVLLPVLLMACYWHRCWWCNFGAAAKECRARKCKISRGQVYFFLLLQLVFLLKFVCGWVASGFTSHGWVPVWR